MTIHEAKTHLSRFVARAAAGEEIVIARGDRPMARLVPLVPSTKDRTPGSARGDIWLAEDFGAPVPDSPGGAPEREGRERGEGPGAPADGAQGGAGRGAGARPALAHPQAVRF